jgi:dihydrofolate reductase
VAAALTLARNLPGEIMVCGGQRIYEETLPFADRLYLTLVEGEPEGDRWFPEWRQLAWRETFRQEAAEGGLRYTFQILERVRS